MAYGPIKERVHLLIQRLYTYKFTGDPKDIEKVLQETMEELEKIEEMF